MQQALVSVALCTYNGEQYLAEQLDSLIRQSYQNLEIIACDDASSDGTWQILERYSQTYPRLKIIRNEQNLGFVKNFEKCLSFCTGELIAFADQDDIWHPDKLRIQAEGIGDNLLYYHDSAFVDEQGNSLNRRMSDVINLYRGDRPETFLFFNCVSGHSILMKRELLKEVLPLPAGYFHDWWIAYVACNLGTIDFSPEALVSYRQHGRSDTNILKLKRDKKDKYSLQTSFEKLEKEINWLKVCAGYPKNKNPKLVWRLWKLMERRRNSYISFRLAFLLSRYREQLFYIQKKSNSSKNNYILKQIWGLRMKTFWDNYVK